MLRNAGGGRGAGGGALGANVGVSGLKALGARDLTYKTAFLACNVASGDARVSPSPL
jgi:DNA replication licensing factor MCM6